MDTIWNFFNFHKYNITNNIVFPQGKTAAQVVYDAAVAADLPDVVVVYN